MEIQRSLGSDIVMAFDQCAPYPCSREQVHTAWKRTRQWAENCREFLLAPHQSLFGIVQGGMEEDLRRSPPKPWPRCNLMAMRLEGYP